MTGEGAEQLIAAIERRLGQRRVVLDLVVDPADGAGVSWLHRHTEVMEKSLSDDGKLAMTVRVDPSRADVVRTKFPALAHHLGKDIKFFNKKRSRAEKRRMRRKARAGLIAAVLALATSCRLSRNRHARFGRIPSTVRGTSSVYLHLAETKGFLAAKSQDRTRADPGRHPTRWWRRFERGEVDIAGRDAAT